MVKYPSSNAGKRTNNIAAQKNNANNSVRRKQYQNSIYKKDLTKQQITKNTVQKTNNQTRNANQMRRFNEVRNQNQVRTAPVYQNINGAAESGIRRQNVQNLNGTDFNRNVRNINSTAAASGRAGTIANGTRSGRRNSIYIKDRTVNGKSTGRQYTSDKITSSGKPSRHYLTGNDITTRIRKKIADGRLYAGEVLKQLFFFKSAEQSKIVTREKKKIAIPLKTLCAISICLIFITTWVFSGIKVYENGKIISKTETDIAALHKQIKEDEIMLEDKNDLSYIENAAVNELGMIKRELLPIQYISIGNSDEVELTNAQNVDYIKVTVDTLKDIFARLK